MDAVSAGCLGTLLVFLLLSLGMPIAFAMFLAGFLGISALASVDAALPAMARAVYETTAHYPYTVIPLFVIMGGFAASSGMTRLMYTAFDRWLGRLPGGLGVATIGACAGFAGVCGSSVATAAAMGVVAIPEMRRFGYNPRLYAGTVAAGGTLGFLIPPSIGFVVYGMLTEQSIGKLLIAGIVPGIVLASAYVAIIMVWAVAKPHMAPSSPEPVSWGEKFSSLLPVWEPLAVFALVVGGIYSGLFTPTEAGGIGATVIFLLALVKKKLTWTVLRSSLLESVRISVMVLFLVAGANVFSTFLALSTVPIQASAWVVALPVSRYVILAIVVLVYLLLGCFLDAISMMVLTMPVIFPVIVNLGFDPIWFGVVAVLMMEAGLLTPPLGLNVFTVAGVAKEAPLESIYQGILPFLLAIIAVVVFLSVFPQVATFLPDAMLR
jgi:tripartite ATP-independent transporter DctM subunit